MDFVTPYAPVVRRWGLRAGLQPNDADDLFQETAIRVWRGLASRPWLRSPKPWLMTIAYRAFLDSRKGARKHGEMVEVADDRQASPTAAAEQLEQQTHLQATVQELPETLRSVVALHYSGGLSLRQIAAAMEINIGTVKSRLNSALVHLRGRLAANEQDSE